MKNSRTLGEKKKMKQYNNHLLKQSTWKYAESDGIQLFDKLERQIMIDGEQYYLQFSIDIQDDPKYKYAIQLSTVSEDYDRSLFDKIEATPGIQIIQRNEDDEDFISMQWNASSIQKVFKPIKTYVSPPSESDLKKLPNYDGLTQSKSKMSIERKRKLVKLLKQYNSSKKH